MNGDRLSAKIFFTVSIIWKGKPLTQPPAALGLTADPGAEPLFRKGYAKAEAFVFNESFNRNRTMAYLGTEFADVTFGAGPATGGPLGPCRVDVVQSCYPAVAVNVLSLHFMPLR